MSVIPGNKAGAVDGSSQNLLSCEICGRHFTQDALARHEPICRKVFNKKRKPFNSLKQRLQGTDIPTVKRKPPLKSQTERKSNWRQQHEDFINAIRSAKLATIAMKEGRPLPPPPPPTINPDYIQCPYCMRRFNEAAAERHINFCKEQAARRAFAPGQKGSKAPPGKQATPKKEPTLTSAVGTLLQNKTQEGTDPSQVVIGRAAETSGGTLQKKAPGIPSGKEPGVPVQGKK
ncbi:zinc finger C2HC domain-containing protein 1B [Podarcis raffonei]|uniref:zinc finger C2HC domain-containing protein 1B n=1 Tax=Podarcis raffonei TaxID=65483 RepID=UPI00232991A4|nr:zinc finger C2HC domain-containing protein 1B [Podarcis raffonei]